MTIVAVAGGLGDFGRLVVDALLATGKHQAYSLSRRVNMLKNSIMVKNIISITALVHCRLGGTRCTPRVFLDSSIQEALSLSFSTDIDLYFRRPRAPLVDVTFALRHNVT